MKKIAVFTGSDLRNYGGGEKDVINWTSHLKEQLDITIYTVRDKNEQSHRIAMEEIEKQLNGVKIIFYKGRKIRLLKDILTFQRFDLSRYDKVYSMCQGFLLNGKLQKTANRFLLGIHTQSTLMDEPIEAHKAWKRFFFRFYRKRQIKVVMKSDEIRIQNSDDMKRLHQIGYKGKIWNVPPAMFDNTPEPVDAGKFYVVWVNRVSPEKRPEELVKVASLMPEVEFHAIGSGRSSQVFDGIPNIKKLGFLSNEELQKEYQGASAYLSTSRGENFGMSAMEAMAHGVVTVSYDVMGLRDFCKVIVFDASEARIHLNLLKLQYERSPNNYLMYRRDIRDQTISKYSNKVILPLVLEMMR